MQLFTQSITSEYVNGNGPEISESMHNNDASKCMHALSMDATKIVTCTSWELRKVRYAVGVCKRTKLLYVLWHFKAIDEARTATALHEEAQSSMLQQQHN